MVSVHRLAYHQNLPAVLMPASMFQIRPWFYRKVLHSLSSPGSTTCGEIEVFPPLFKSSFLPKPNPPCLGSPNSSPSPPFINIMRALSPPNVLLGLKPALSLEVLSASWARFLKSGMSRLSSVIGARLLLPSESTYCEISSQPLESEASIWEKRFQSLRAGSPFLKLGRKTFQTKPRKAAINFLSLIDNITATVESDLYGQLLFQQMSTRQRPLREKMEISLKLDEYWESFLSNIPQEVRSPSLILNALLQLCNYFLRGVLFFILVMQTAHILNAGDTRYINLRHILIKWVLLVAVVVLADTVDDGSNLYVFFSLFCHLFALIAVYPSKFIKSLHLKYFSFSERKKYDDSHDDLSGYEMGLFVKMLTSIILFFLNSSRFLITFVPLEHRKRIEESMRGVNMVIVEEKYFWKMYENNWNSSNQIAQNTQALPNLSSSHSLARKTPTPKNSHKNSTGGDQKDLKHSLLSPRMPENFIRSKVSQYVEIIISTIPSLNSRKFSLIREAELIYNLETSELRLIGETDGKETEHILLQIALLDDGKVQMMCEDEEEPLFLSFKQKKDRDLFLASLPVEN